MKERYLLCQILHFVPKFFYLVQEATETTMIEKVPIEIDVEVDNYCEIVEVPVEKIVEVPYPVERVVEVSPLSWPRLG